MLSGLTGERPGESRWRQRRRKVGGHGCLGLCDDATTARLRAPYHTASLQCSSLLVVAVRRSFLRANPRCLLHVPFTSLFSPFLNLPRNVERVLSPPLNLATQYYESFENGTQARALSRFTDEVYKLGAFDMAGKVFEHWRDRAAKKAEAEAAAQRDESAQAAREARDRVKEQNPKE